MCITYCKWHIWTEYKKIRCSPWESDFKDKLALHIVTLSGRQSYEIKLLTTSHDYDSGHLVSPIGVEISYA